jgi:hypothetical protein
VAEEPVSEVLVVDEVGVVAEPSAVPDDFLNIIGSAKYAINAIRTILAIMRDSNFQLVDFLTGAAGATGVGETPLGSGVATRGVDGSVFVIGG